DSIPTTPGAFQAAHTPGGHVFYDNPFVMKLSADGSSLIYSTYLHGGGGDDARGIAVDSTGNAYVTGITGSTDFPTTPGAFQTTFAGGTCGSAPYTYQCYDAFVTELNPTGTALVFSSYLGGSGNDSGSSLATDSAGNAYVIGNTNSTDFPITLGALQNSGGYF